MVDLQTHKAGEESERRPRAHSSKEVSFGNLRVSFGRVLIKTEVTLGLHWEVGRQQVMLTL